MFWYYPVSGTHWRSWNISPVGKGKTPLLFYWGKNNNLLEDLSRHCWLERSHMAIPTFKEAWEKETFASQLCRRASRENRAGNVRWLHPPVIFHGGARPGFETLSTFCLSFIVLLACLQFTSFSRN